MKNILSASPSTSVFFMIRTSRSEKGDQTFFRNAHDCHFFYTVCTQKIQQGNVRTARYISSRLLSSFASLIRPSYS